MNPRQRKGVLFLIAAGVGSILVFALVASYVADVQAKTGTLTTALKLKADTPAYQSITDEMVEVISIPVRWSPPTALRNPQDLLGLVTGVDLPRGSLLQAGMLVGRPQLAPGQREIAILVDAETGVAGKITAGSIVDIYATFDTAKSAGVARSQIIVTRARIIDVGVPEPASNNQRSGTFAEGKVVPVTFALSTTESLVLTHAESFATKVRLALVGNGDKSSPPPEERIFSAAGQPASQSRIFE